MKYTENALNILTARTFPQKGPAWIDKNLQGCENPRVHGKGLIENRSGQWRYRVGDYRLIAEIQEKEITILIVNVGHRRSIYDK